MASCAMHTLSMDSDPIIQEKLSINLRTAIMGYGPHAPLGKYIQVSLLLNRNCTKDDMEAISQYGIVGTVAGSVVTVTLRKKRLYQLAYLSQVRHIQLDINNIHNPREPPPIN